MWPGEKKLKDIEIDRSDLSTTLRSMRRALNEMQRHKPLVQMAADTAHHHGLNGEDHYTFLAYELLRVNENLEQITSRYIDRARDTFIVVSQGDTTAEDALMDLWLTLSSFRIGPKGTLWPVYTRTRDALIKCGRLQESATQPGVFEEIKRK